MLWRLRSQLVIIVIIIIIIRIGGAQIPDGIVTKFCTAIGVSDVSTDDHRFRGFGDNGLVNFTLKRLSATRLRGERSN